MILPRILGRGCISILTRSMSIAVAPQQVLELYFAETQFSLSHANDLSRLKQYMGLVYPRQRRLVLIDLEAYERSPLTITEVGIAIYDPHGMECAMIPHIHSIHLIVQQHKNKFNGKFVPDNKFAFNGGTSYVVGAVGVKRVLQKLIDAAAASNDVFISHGVGSDIKFLKLIGVKVPESMATVDTHTLYSMSFDRYATLKNTCRRLQIPVSRMHNGGNDAYYTLLAAMKMCDPLIRHKLGLDQCATLEVVPKNTIQSQKFSDRTQLVPKKGDEVWHELEGIWFSASGTDD